MRKPIQFELVDGPSREENKLENRKFHCTHITHPIGIKRAVAISRPKRATLFLP